MALFENCSVLLELKDLPFKEKKRLKLAVTENGGSISYVVNKQCSLIVTSDLSTLSSNRLRSLQKHSTPVVGVDYVYRCLERGLLLPLEEHRLSVSPPSLSSSSPPFLPRSWQKPGPLSQQVSKVTTGKPVVTQSKDPPQTVSAVRQAGKAWRQEGNDTFLGKFRVHTENDKDLPKYPDDFEVAKYSIFEKVTSRSWCVLELQSSIAEEGQRYRVVRYRKDDTGAKSVVVRDKLVFLSTSEEAMEVYQALRKELQVKGHTLRNNLPSQVQDMGSAALKQLLLEEKLNTGSLSQEVGVFVELLWTEALGCLGNILKVPITSLSLNDVSRTEGMLLQAQKKLREARHAEVASLMDQVYTLLPHREPCPPANAKLISQKLDLCQLIRDVLNVSEVTLRSPSPSCLGKYRALRCSVERLPPDTPEFQSVTDLLQDREVQVQQVLRVSRGAELQMFKKELGNVKPLLHSSRPSSFVGILSRGLLLPRAGVEHHGIERTDIGNLGSGIYFTDSMSASLRYSTPGVTDGSRLLLVCDVALGRCRDVQKRDPDLTQAPLGYHSVHGVRRTPTAHSEFEDDEFVVYRPEQVKLKYVVQFSVEDDQLKDFHPSIDTSSELPKPTSDQVLSIEEDGVGSVKNPLEGVTAGLLDSSGQQLPLQAVHVKCKLMDLLSQVIIFQKYTNQSSVPIEAKYVFPLDDSAAVCGFEAFINGKHVVGQVKEKEQARMEYKQALERGHGAYLMDQDAPDVFTISVGNLPPGATVLIKVTFVSELIVRDGCVFFSLSGSVAPWQQSAALNQTTQTTLEKVCVTDLAARTGEFTLDLSAEMPCEITSLHCISHNVRVKKTDCKAVVSVLAGEVMGPDGFQLSITLSHIHLPRMWVEHHPDKDSQACMLVFYSKFDLGSRSALNELVLLLDTSESMRGDALQNARRIALEVLKTLDRNLRVNVVFFGTDHTEAFLEARPLMEALQPAKKFIMSSPPVGGSTELWRPLRGLSLLPPSRGLRNLLLLSDGHIQNPSLTLQLVRDNAKHSRLFTCGLSPTANRHMLRALAQAGGGTYEFFDTKTKHNWSEKVVSQVKRTASPGCSSVSVKWQQFSPTASLPVQAPSQLHALFNDCHTLVYGFVPHCTQATLLGNLSGQEIKTMVSTSELQKTRGTFLHKLTARAVIRDYEDGSLDTNEAEHEGKKAELKSFIVELSKEFSILSQFTSFVAIEERDGGRSEPEQFTDIPKLIAEEDVDFLPYMSWMEDEELEEEELEVDELEEEELEEEELEEVSEAMLVVELEEEKLIRGAMFPRSEEPIEGDMALMDFGHLTFGSYIPHTAERHGGMERRRRYMGGGGEGAVGQLAVRDSEMLLSGPFDDIDLEQRSSFVQRTFSPKHRQALFHDAPCPPPDLLQTDSLLMTLASCETKMSHPGGHPPSAQYVLCAPPRLSNSSFFSSFPASCPPPPPVPQKYGSAGGGPPPPPRVPLNYGFAWGGPPPPPPPVPQRYGPAGGGHYAPPPPPHSQCSVFALSSPSPLVSTVPEIQTTSGHQQLNALTSPDDLMHFSLSFAPAEQMDEPPEFMDCHPAAPAPVYGDGVDVDSSPFTPAGSARLKSARTLSGFQFGSAQTINFERASPSPVRYGNLSQRPAIRLAGQTSGFGSMKRKMAVPLRCGPSNDGDTSVTVANVPFASTSVHPAAAMRLGQSEDSYRSFVPAGRRRLRRGSFEASSVTPGCSDLLAIIELSRAASSQRLDKNTGEDEVRMEGSPIMDCEEEKQKWIKIFHMQHSDGYWECTAELGTLMKVDMDSFTNVFLKNKGICSLGVRAHADILRLVASLLVLQLMRLDGLDEGKLLRTLFSLDEPQPRCERWEALKKAVGWVCWADRQYPCIYSRLEFGWSWESSTRQLLGYERPPALSPLSGATPWRTGTPLEVQ